MSFYDDWYDDYCVARQAVEELSDKAPSMTKQEIVAKLKELADSL